MTGPLPSPTPDASLPVDDAVAGRRVPGVPDDPAALRAALAGVSALLVDVDGVLTMRGAPVPGAREAIARLVERRMPFRLLTNTSLVSRAGLSGRLAEIGIRVGPESIVSCLSASAELTATRWRDQPLFVFATPDALAEFAGQRVLSDDEAAGPRASAAAVVVGDADHGFTYARLNTAFRLVRGGARLVAMHRNAWWAAADGIRLDSGSFVRALEYATERRALIVGKPSPTFYRLALRSLGVPHAHVAMVGDDMLTDVGGSGRAGLRSVLVLTGRHGRDEIEAAARKPRAVLPTGVAPSLAEVVAALD